MDGSKVQAVLNCLPVNMKQFRGFLRLTATMAFTKLKETITQAPVLALPAFDKSAYIRELFAITEAMAKFHHYLSGHKFIICTDQKSLKSLMDQTIQTLEQQSWLHKFLGYDFAIEYKPGRDNIAADALSRSFMMALFSHHSILIQQIHEAIKADSTLTALKAQCLAGTQADTNYQVQHDSLFWKDRLVVPAQPSLIAQILTEFHASPIGGHSGILCTKARICQQFYWPNMSKDIVKSVSECLICQQAKSASTLSAGLLQPLPIPSRIWEDIAMNFITGLPMSHSLTVIFVVIDRLSKYAHFAPLKTDFTSAKVAETFMHSVVKLHGIPKSIVSDRDKVFTNRFWQQLFKLVGTILGMSTSYHPQTDGQSEALNKCLEMYLRCFTGSNPKSWSRLLSWDEFCSGISFAATPECKDASGVSRFGPEALYRLWSFASATHHLQTRHVHSNGQIITQVLVQWEGLTEAGATWEDWETLQASYPSLSLEDKVSLNGEGNVMNTNHKMTKEDERKGQMSIIPHDQERRVSNRLKVLVYHDLLGMLQHPHHAKVTPKFCKQYARVGDVINKALLDYKEDVINGSFPDAQHSPYKISETDAN
ncbi:hypothetical protein L195_g029819, partial [Trifolium pratense]